MYGQTDMRRSMINSVSSRAPRFILNPIVLNVVNANVVIMYILYSFYYVKLFLVVCVSKLYDIEYLKIENIPLKISINIGLLLIRNKYCVSLKLYSTVRRKVRYLK